ncbi:MAG: PD40 domain-containing protein [Chloroflexi bacterium]|nr:PD40 domain-containing protein [Chloroflexota bacterium]
MPPPRLSILGLLIIILILGIPLFSASAEQSSTLLQGPLVVTNTPEQDGFLLIDLATGQQRRLSFGPGNHYIGGFSPNGCEIVFTWEQRPGYGDLYAVRLDGSHLHRLLDLGSTGALSYRAWEPEWSPDGSKIVFTLIRYYDPADQEPYRTSHIAWVTPQGGRPEFYSNSGMESQPRWSSDGRRLVYVSNQPVITTATPEAESASAEDIEGKPELWVVNADGQNKFRLTSFAANAVYNPRWSPTDFYIAFVYQVQPNFHQLMVMPSDGSAPAMVINEQAGTILDFVWQPTGDALIAAMQNFGGETRNILWRLTLPNGPNTFLPTPLINDPTSLYHDYPRFSADGRWVAFRAAYELQVYDTVLGEVQTFGSATMNNNPPVWSPAGFQGEAACPSK